MARATTIAELCRTCGNETAHTEHVARLALELFDAVQAPAGLTRADRDLLELAARVHDIGYASSPDRHVTAGVGLVLRGDVPGVARQDARVVAGVVLLHSRAWKDARAHPLFRGAAPGARVLRLGAILRVADGLDHGHVQDLYIRKMSRAGGVLTVRVESPGFAGNIDAGRRKADLWNEVMPVRLEIAAPTSTRLDVPFSGLLAPDMTAVEVARRLLFYHYRMISEHSRLAPLEDDPIHLHDIRVGMRRFRSVLRLFRGVLAGTRADAVDAALRLFGARLGPIRDADVWRQRLQAFEGDRKLVRDPRWRVYVLRHERAATRARRRLLAILAGREYRALLKRMATLLRVELPALLLDGPNPPAEHVVGRRIRRVVRRLTEPDLFHKSLSADSMHEIRIMARRGRYWSEFAAPLYGKRVVVLARRLKAVADALGSLHDLDLALEHVESDPLAPAALPRRLRRERAELLDEAAIAWRRLRKPRMVARALAVLD